MTRLFRSGLRFIGLDMVRLCPQHKQPSYLIHFPYFILPPVTNCESPWYNKRTYASDNTRFTPENQLATLDTFAEVDKKNKESYLDLLHFYKAKEKRRRGHVEFIYAALKHMKEFGVHKDLEAYKALMEVMPKGKFVAQTFWQSEYQHYPKQQQCIIDLLTEMEENGVIPDEEMEDLLINIFGRRSYAIRKFWRMMYWMPKFKNLSPWALPDDLPDNSLELAKLAIARITSVDPGTKITVYETKQVKDAIDDTWIVSGVSPLQQELFEQHDSTRPLFVEGSFRVWLRNSSVSYFILRADPAPDKGPEPDVDDIRHIAMPLFSEATERVVAKSEVVHQQEEGTILAVCATGSSSRDSLLSWIRLLQKDNPRLGEIPVLFTLKSPVGPTEPIKEIEGEELLPVVNIDTNK
ncbi:evolutionarily conserved signaling intermediate in Toll pathway, mitochondrial-like [Macrosteles quadrilineatus]|uniref:evolutionarily conserved signaling intermediate in Toll pathway, mitochondrial-like n=1 Tax=Macrosteles quadrilineatus TaxID=74068 RepID=UPI0023E28C1F|nr:evolutionarily conserved signaling intermediate in Toll pathway, mitochondrial-like [Macrosteles quadrilineatus]